MGIHKIYLCQGQIQHTQPTMVINPVCSRSPYFVTEISQFQTRKVGQPLTQIHLTYLYFHIFSTQLKILKLDRQISNIQCPTFPKFKFPRILAENNIKYQGAEKTS